MTTGIAALNRLRMGNQRFVEGNLAHRSSGIFDRKKMAAQQSPFAIILGCSDSRAPAEMIFDQGIGDLFVIRVAGNIVAPSLVGSVDYAVQQFGTPLVVVLGHSHCGAVTACVEHIQRQAPHSNAPESANINSIVERIRPAIHTLAETPLGKNKEEFIKHAVRANVRASVSNLRYSSPTIERAVGRDDLLIIGAELSLETGLVDFFEGIPQTGTETVSLSE